MLRVFLDQGHWVSLSKALHGKDSPPGTADVLGIARLGVRMGILSFPLWSGHYLETWNRASRKSRYELADTMLALARRSDATAPDTLAAYEPILHMELDLALQRRFGTPVDTRVIPLFGSGVMHAFGVPELELFSGWPPEIRFSKLATTARIEFETSILRGTETDLLAEHRNRKVYDGPAERYQQHEENLIEQFKAEQAAPQRREELLTGVALLDFFDHLSHAMLLSGISGSDFMSLGKDGVGDFIRDLPCRDVGLALDLQRHQNPRLPREKGDLVDIGSLALAIPYCDIVVTENRWQHFAIQAGLDRRYETIIISNLHDLAPVLAQAA